MHKKIIGSVVAITATLVLTGCSQNIAEFDKGRESIEKLQNACDEVKGSFSLKWVDQGYRLSCFIKEENYVD